MLERLDNFRVQSRAVHGGTLTVFISALSAARQALGVIRLQISAGMLGQQTKRQLISYEALDFS